MFRHVLQPILRSRSLSLLVTLVVVIAFARGLGEYPLIGAAFFCLIPIAAVVAISTERHDMIVGIVLAVPAVAIVAYSVFFSEIPFSGWEAYVIVAYYAVVTVMLLRHIARLRTITFETFAAAISVYLLVGISFALAYMAEAVSDPSAFAGPDVPSNVPTAIYFSFVTLTTLGYGDIQPISNAARTLAIFEAICGVLYLGAIIGRLVGLTQATVGEEDEKK